VTWQAWYTLTVVAATVYVLARDLMAPAAAVVGAMIALLVAGVVGPADALQGFGNPAPITVAALYVLARAVDKTGGLQPLVNATLGGAKGRRWPLVRLLTPTALASGFLNNTPIVAMLSPQVTEWAERRGLSPSRFLMPLSFATILGGVVTVIGTSTNLVVSGLMEQDGLGAMGMFEISRLGLPVAAAGLALVVLLAPLVLPDRRQPRQALAGEGAREFVVSMRVVEGGTLDGRAVEEGGLRHLQGVFLVEVERGNDLIAPVAPTTVLRGGDLLTFVGKADLVLDLQNQRGLASAEAKHVDRFDTHRHTFFEVVIGASSPLAGKTLREAEFRGRYQAAVIAIHRAGQRVTAKLGGVRLKVGDTLLLLTDPEFGTRWRDRQDFLLAARVGGTPPAVARKAWLVGVIGAGVVLLAGSGLLPILQASLVAGILLVVFGVLTAGEARGAIDLDVILVIAASFALGAAIERSGLADILGGQVMLGFAGFGPRGILLGIVLATILLTEMITNNAAAVLVFPIGMAVAERAGLDPRGVALAIAVSASASFLTPIGYQTNTMVYGPGGYRFGDYARLGAPLTVIVIIVTVMVAPI
jgi:di/tricarboxylate transporter